MKGRAGAAALALLLGCSAPEARLYEPPAPGSYELPAIDAVDEHDLVDPDGVTAPILGLEPGQAAVVSFVYRSCSDAGGCPLALAVLRDLDRALAREPELAARVRLVTVSFDPARDTPAHMGELRGLMEPRGAWTFLTARSDAELAPVLRDYGQDVAAQIDPHGEGSGLLRHVLKVFLVDAHHQVRNVYSSGFLDAELIRNDLLTVLADAR